MVTDDCLEWLNFARMDITAAQDLFKKQQNPRHRPIEIILYHCQQCAEKALKAFIVQYHGSLKRDLQIHNLQILRGECEQWDNSFLKQRIIDHCSNLDPFSVAIRYPNHTMQLDSALALRGINSAKRIFNFTCQQLGLDKSHMIKIP